MRQFGTATSERGLALVSVLWIVMLLALIAASLMSSLNFAYRLAHNVDERAKADAWAEAGVNRAILTLLDRRPEQRWRADGIAREFVYDGARLRVSIHDELGKIDLNVADGLLLARLFQSAGVDAQKANVLSDRVLDWRDPGDLHRLNGAKEPEYRAAGYSYRPRNGPFQSVDELKLVMGMTPALFARIEPALTVYSGRPSIDPQTAPREALLALPGLAATMVGEATGAVGGPADGATATAPAFIDSMLALGGRAFTIRAEVDMGAQKFVRDAVVRMTDNPAEPYWILVWR